jgi:threonine synthase
MAEPAIQTHRSVSQLHCIGCGRTALADRFRCEHCRDLLEIIYPGWEDRGPGGLSSAALKQLWRDRRSSLEPFDQSGVWRFREILPEIPQPQIITIKEGNTPVYDCRTVRAVLASRSFLPNIRA